MCNFIILLILVLCFLVISNNSREDNCLKSTTVKLKIGNRPVSMSSNSFYFIQVLSRTKVSKTASRSKWKISSDKDILERNHHPSIFLEFMWKIGRLRLYVVRCFIFKRLDSTLSLSQIHQGWHQILNGSRFSKGFVSYRLHHFSKPWRHCHCTKSISSFILFRFSFF